MDTLNLIASICSILGLIITLILTSNVISIKNRINNDSSTRTNQKKNQVGGDQAARDITK